MKNLLEPAALEYTLPHRIGLHSIAFSRHETSR